MNQTKLSTLMTLVFSLLATSSFANSFERYFSSRDTTCVVSYASEDNTHLTSLKFDCDKSGTYNFAPHELQRIQNSNSNLALAQIIASARKRGFSVLAPTSPTQIIFSK